MDIINKLVFNHVYGTLVASHAFIAVVANVDRIIKVALTYFSAAQIDAAVDAAAAATKARVDADSKK